ncbi:hypothetical protein G7Y41_08900 [Schaalia sp. ZJ405]|uniref:hypothetical protein n=1 Tax=Schaalia sp. ZJ405 TaxID=2709403 RepID=UPI0013ECDB98|nr:hypothetical protein [Schaalia sp. ZJ405]QPK81143.1 hypothetical protein G7Y41_08900 [Schaalia sp. ZJ405]
MIVDYWSENVINIHSDLEDQVCIKIHTPKGVFPLTLACAEALVMADELTIAARENQAQYQSGGGRK